MTVLDKHGLVAYKNAMLISFTPKVKPQHGFGSIEGVLDNIYSCVMGRQFSGTAQEKFDIAMEAKRELGIIYKNFRR